MSPRPGQWQRANRNSPAQAARRREQFVHISTGVVEFEVTNPDGAVRKFGVLAPKGQGHTYRKSKEST